MIGGRPGCRTMDMEEVPHCVSLAPLASPHILLSCKAQLGEPFLECLILFFFFFLAKPACKSPKLALKCFKPALKRSDILFPYRSPSHRPHHDPTQHPRNGPGTDPKRSQTEPNGAERSQTEPKWTKIKPSRVGRPGGFVGMGRGGGCKRKRISLLKRPNRQ